MKNRKTRRSRCASDTCGKQFRHADPSAATCSPACRQRVFRIRRKAKQKRERWETVERAAAALLKRRTLLEAEGQGAETERSATARHVEEGSPPSEPARQKCHLVDADGLGRCGVHQVGENHATSVKAFITLARLSVPLCEGCVGAVNRESDRRARREPIGGLGNPPPPARVILIPEMPDRAPMTPLGLRY